MPQTPTKQKTQNIPELRFPGFEGEWEEKKLGELLTFKNGINASKEQYGRGIKFINVLDIIENDFITHDKIRGSVDITDKEFENSKVSFGDILFQRSSETREEVGQANVYLDKEHMATFGGFVIAGKKIEEYVPSFMNYLLRTQAVRKDITSRSGGSTRYNIGQSALKAVCIGIPSLPEQQKIADFLGSVDEWIEYLRAEKDAWEKYKKGMMQKIFAQEIRFKDDDGKDFPEWEEKKLEEIGSIRTSSVDKKSNAGDKEVKLLNYMDVYRRDHIFSTDPFQEVTAKDKQISSFALVKGDILFTPSSEIPVDIGHSAVVMEDLPNVLFSYHLLRFRPKGNLLQPLFSGYAFKSFAFYKKLWRLAQGATRFTLSLENMKGVSVSFPKSLEEQQKIADFLTSLDKVVESKQQQITAAEKWKKGLMQGLFV